MSGSSVELVGNLTRAPELRFTPSGAAVANFGVAVNRRWQNKQTNEWEEQVSFFDVVCWRDLAENVCESLDRGDRVMVVGRLDQRSWENSDGEKRSKVEVVADEVGPSLRWATATVAKVERATGDGGFQPATGTGDGYGTAKTPAYSADEEPFVVDAGTWDPGAFGHYPERMLR